MTLKGGSQQGVLCCGVGRFARIRGVFVFVKVFCISLYFKIYIQACIETKIVQDQIFRGKIGPGRR